MGTDEQRQTHVESVLRATRLLECFSPGEPALPLTELVRRGGYSKTTTYRLLTTLEHAGWLSRTAAGAFRLTVRPFQIGSILVDDLDVRHEAPPLMRQLSLTVELTSYLTIAAGTQAVCIERIDRGTSVRVMDLDVGGSQALNLGAAPRALLAFDEENLLADLLRTPLEARTPHSIATEASLRADLAETRRRGYSISDSDVTPGIAALGAPIFDRHEHPVASISIGGMSRQMIPPRPGHVAALLDAAHQISARLGSRTAGGVTAADGDPAVPRPDRSGPADRPGIARATPERL
jgi:DNA-binding IclR family transcriptional regulator